MSKFTVTLAETQYWVYSYEVDADNEEAAKDIGRNLFYDGKQADDGGLCDAAVTNVTTQEIENA